ncbi:MAG: hypothetical protein Q7S86_01425 [bacterium]|nr:hypothetical protein [bacterium]
MFGVTKITKVSNGWKTALCNKAPCCGSIHISFIKAVRCCYKHGGRLTIPDLADGTFPIQKVTLQDCIEEHEEGVLDVIRWSWIGGYRHLAQSKDSQTLIQAIGNELRSLRKIQQMLGRGTHRAIRVSLEEAIGQFELLLHYSIIAPRQIVHKS